MPALGLTDHGVMNGAVEHYKACREHGIKPILGLEAYLVDDRARRGTGRAQPPDPARRRTTPGFRNLVKLTSAGFLEGFKRGKAERRHRAARPPLRRRDRAHRLPPVALLPPAGRGAPGRRPRPPRRPGPGLRGRERLLRDPGERDRRAGEGQRGHRPLRARARPAAGGDGRRPLPAPRGLRQPRGAALRADQVDARAAEADLRHQRVLPQERQPRWRSRSRLAGGGADDARDRRALRGRDRARQAAAAALPDPRRRGAARDAAPARARGPAPPLRRSAAGRGGRAARVRARGDRRDGLRLLLPDRLGLRHATRRRTGSPSARDAAPRPARSSPTRSTSPTSTRSPTTCCSSAS